MKHQACWDRGALVVALLAGCTESTEALPGGSELLEEPRAERAGTSLAAPDDGGAPEGVVHPSAGWVDRPDALISPWCAAVLVAPDVVVTAASCVQTLEPSALRFGLGTPERGGGVQVRAMRQLHADRVVLLDLEEPVFAGRTAESPVSPPKPGSPVEGIALRFVGPSDPSARWIWSATLAYDGSQRVDLAEGATVDDFAHADENALPNCHGDLGSGVFTLDGALIGIVVGAVSIDDASPCVASLEVAPVDLSALLGGCASPDGSSARCSDH